MKANITPPHSPVLDSGPFYEAGQFLRARVLSNHRHILMDDATIHIENDMIDAGV
jgi:hypothetical protein